MDKYENDEKQKNYTINMKVNIKKSGIGNYAIRGSENYQTEEKKSTIVERSEIMHHKPISKV